VSEVTVIEALSFGDGDLGSTTRLIEGANVTGFLRRIRSLVVQVDVLQLATSTTS